MLRLVRDGEGLSAELIWESRRLKSKFAPMVYHDGAIFGLDDGVLVALDPETGERLWKRGRYGHGQFVLVGDLLLIQTEDGDVVLVEATSDGHRELASLTALTDKTWNPPALAGRMLLVRNSREAAAYELPLLR
jgi:outer membrane protein assembly factor BamB